jgi:MFS transporter, FHS family, L-fucose permease
MREKPSRLLWVLFLAYFTFGMITNVLGVVIPMVIGEYHLSLFRAGILAFALFLAYGLCSIPTGLLMDRVGARPLILGGLFLMAAGCLAISLIRDYYLMVTMTFVVGVGITFLQTSGNPLIQYLDRPENYHRNLTLTIGFCGIGAFAGPFVLAFFTGTGSPWERLYLSFAVLCGLVFALVAFSETPARAVKLVERIQLDQLGRLLTNPIVITYALGIFFYVGGEVGIASWIVKFFERVHGYAAEGPGGQAGTIISKILPTLPALTVALFWGLQGLGRLVSGAVLNRFGSRRMLRIYSFCAVASLLSGTFGSRNMTVLGFSACGFFTSILFTLVFSGTINSFTTNQGTISGLLLSASLGGAIIPPLVGLVGDNLGMRAAMMLPAVCFSYVFGLSILGKAKYD